MIVPRLYKYPVIASAKPFPCVDVQPRPSSSVHARPFDRENQPPFLQTGGTNYRPDLQYAALVRWSKVHRALRVQKGEMKPMTVSAGRKNLKASA